MIIDNINLNLLRVFECVYRTKSMTDAAKELHLTQSGVSQNIKHLEEILDLQLFDRVKQRPIPTYKAHGLYKKTSIYLYELESAIAELTGQEEELSGCVSMGFPVEFGNNLIIPILANLALKHPHISYKIKYGGLSTLSEMLLKGEVDIAIFSGVGALDKQIENVAVRDETMILCCTKDYFEATGGKKKFDKDYFESLEYVELLEDAALVKSWFRHHFNVTRPNIKVRATLMNVRGVARMITAGMGVGILPQHTIERLQNEGHKLHLYNQDTKPFVNTISMAFLTGRTLSPAAIKIKKMLGDSLKKQ
ncbi:MAG: LysR family transcriptional regulator [Bacteriovoracaceae bacterium]|nr:LysR family transcriptional regulator [Bacteriovoracaceae bacterium]